VGGKIDFINTCESYNYLTLQHIINVLHYLFICLIKFIISLQTRVVINFFNKKTEL
jgi:hypothetical protein